MEGEIMTIEEIKDMSNKHDVKESYLSLANLINVMKRFDTNPSMDNLDELTFTIKTSLYPYPLPSGEKGNALAAALELQMYQSALAIIKNSQDLKIDLNNILTTKPNISAQSLFNYSLSYFNMAVTKEQERDLSLLPNALRRIKNNILAVSAIQEELNNKSIKR